MRTRLSCFVVVVAVLWECRSAVLLFCDLFLMLQNQESVRLLVCFNRF